MTKSLDILTVSELTRQIRLQLESSFDSVWVEGEISNLRSPSSGHLYFTLKDENSQIKTVVFRSHMRFLKFEIKDGIQVISRGRVSVYEPRGDYQLIVDYIEPKGVGALQLAYEQLKERLKSEGLFDNSHKKPLPLLPRKIGLVTSSSGAAVQDMINIILRRFPSIEILILPVRVQGEGASSEIAHAIEELNRISGIDVMIVGRGGGSLEDLWAFNEEIVARAIYHSDIPVISAVGHEIDFTISDFVADLRAPTPSAAAELVVPNKSELVSYLENWMGRLENLVFQSLESNRNKLGFLEKRLSDPRRRIDDFRLRIDDIFNHLSVNTSNLLRRKAEQLERKKDALISRSPKGRIGELKNFVSQLNKEIDVHIRHYLGNQRHRFERSLEGLDRLSPLNVLRRGYSITRALPDYSILKDVKGLKVGDRINVKLHRGEIIGQIKQLIEGT
ncbi:MAG: exodeoxyribonuclease VII large subunit [Deltaproteobacteria bacterium CG12_big_fil_rev_8_21_14_0_65_43_10]|nr:MAG: exodeoxyribonuclease VII large subunit [Deltaproteobacteria bacterium CG2_30_43_15]PIQ46078.1 MAG: exodeoxyribonuclease VII large subunit [Deltaproteobacteria bacterium CG12_big_fil_rev_8_21_14_0_65_43_10]PIX25063.1 MAG: exodeoxyribonuclease VII large subunit [Deltaproteobacteria bacterium CG_4_8_14_3_um_filter_43_13]PIZ18742.1 MAG: exodeoxyribonuclease VII large subunit [Deltaproteobacteria bacterium CG_4_10_14_0_8_um_filter_43_12]PJB44990.1 MAG: exodeoxyribonuclease VII large subunit 